MKREPLRTKVVIIGLDGASFNLIDLWIRQKQLPTFERLRYDGAWGKLKSTIPPVSPSAWTSIFTGVNPGKHGIFSFVKRLRGTYFFTPISSQDRKAPPIWKLVSECGKKVIALNIPFSFPPDRINGIMSSGLGAPSKNCNFIFPSHYKEKIIRKFPNIDVDFDEELLGNHPSKLLDKIHRVTKDEIRLTKYLLRNEKWSLFISVFRALDVLQHFFWNKKEILLKYYKKFDGLIQWILGNLNGEFILLICSDHGFNVLHTKVYVNNWLQNLGLLQVKRKSYPKEFDIGKRIQDVLLKLRWKKFLWKVKRSKALKAISAIIPSKTLDHIHLIDWTKTEAYFSECTYGIHITDIVKESNETTYKKRYDMLRRHIKDEAYKLVNPKTGESVVKQVFFKEDLFFGNMLNGAPDVILLKREGYRLVPGYNIADKIFENFRTQLGDHNEEDGVLICYGFNVKKGYEIQSPYVCDIAPTVLHVLGLPILENIDGKVLRDIFEENSELVKIPVKYQHTEREKISKKIKRLKALGKI